MYVKMDAVSLCLCHSGLQHPGSELWLLAFPAVLHLRSALRGNPARFKIHFSNFILADFRDKTLTSEDQSRDLIKKPLPPAGASTFSRYDWKRIPTFHLTGSISHKNMIKQCCW